MSAVRVKDLGYRYGDGSPALAGVSFAIGGGECVGIVGPNGSGKSTLLLHLNGILPDGGEGSGTVEVDDLIAGRGTLHEIRRRVGLLFQDPDDQLFCTTIEEDVGFGPRQAGMTEVQVSRIVGESLARVGMAGHESRSPHRLSGGEKRRACLAGVLACQPSVLVLDEPSAGLDPRGRRELLALLRDIRATRIVASHDLEFIVALCSRTILLDGGRVIADGETRTILGDEALMLEHGLERPHSLLHRRSMEKPDHPHDHPR